MAASVITSFAGTKEFAYLLHQPAEKLAQHILVQRDMIRDLRSLMTDTHVQELDDLREQLSYTKARILELDELLDDANETISRLRDGDAVEWNVDFEGGNI